MQEVEFDRFKLLNVLQFLIFAVIGLIFCLVINGFWGWVLFGGWLLGVWLHMESALAFLTIERNWINISLCNFNYLQLGLKML